MKIGILTQPFRGNYGGILQNWALQRTLRSMGHEPVTIDILPRSTIGRFISPRSNLLCFGSFLHVGERFRNGAISVIRCSRILSTGRS